MIYIARVFRGPVHGSQSWDLCILRPILHPVRNSCWAKAGIRSYVSISSLALFCGRFSLVCSSAIASATDAGVGEYIIGIDADLDDPEVVVVVVEWLDLAGMVYRAMNRDSACLMNRRRGPNA
jgi:hypothetical protein